MIKGEIMGNIQKLLDRNVIQINETRDFSQVENELNDRNPRVVYVANKEDIANDNESLDYARIVISKDFLDVETTTGVERVTENNDALNIIQNALANENDVTLTPSDLMDLTIDERHL